MKTWESKQGLEFFKRVGIRRGQKILDFGAGAGRYTIPAAKLVGNSGMVYSVEKAEDPLKELKQKTELIGLKNVRIVKGSEDVRIDLPDKSIDVALLYDVLHYFKTPVRKLLYQEVCRVLKVEGLLSVYPKHVMEDVPLSEFEAIPKHVMEDVPLSEFEAMHAADVRQEIENAGFLFERKHCTTLSHDDYLNQGCVFNFRKKT